MSKSVTDMIANVTARAEESVRKKYLDSKGIEYNEPLQMELIFPGTIGARNDLRHLPNDYARASLFTVRNKREPRKTLIQEKLFHYNEYISLLYTGIELRAEDDELIWLQILHYGQKTPLGEPFGFSIRDLVRDIGWAKNGRNYNRARESISRLKATELLARNAKAYGYSGAISLISNYTTLNDLDGLPLDYQVTIDRNLIVLFAGNTFTSHTWLNYRDLSPVARRLADYVASHENPFPLSLDRFRGICGSFTVSVTSWRQTVKKACKELVETKIIKTAFLDKKDQIIVCR